MRQYKEDEKTNTCNLRLSFYPTQPLYGFLCAVGRLAASYRAARWEICMIGRSFRGQSYLPDSSAEAGGKDCL